MWNNSPLAMIIFPMGCLLQPQAPAPAFYTAEPPQGGTAQGSGLDSASPALAALAAFAGDTPAAALPPQGAGYDTRCDRCAALQQLSRRSQHPFMAAGSLRSQEVPGPAASSLQRLVRLRNCGSGAAAEEQSSRAVDCGASPIVVLPATACLQKASKSAYAMQQHKSMQQQLRQQQQYQAASHGNSSTAVMAAADNGDLASQACQLTAGGDPDPLPPQTRPAWVVTGRELALRLQRRAEVEAADIQAAAEQAMDRLAAAAEATIPLQEAAAAAETAFVASHAQTPAVSPATAAAELHDAPAPLTMAAHATGYGQPLPSSPGPAAAGSPVLSAAVQQTPHQNPLFETADAADTVDAADTQLATCGTAQQQHGAVQV